MTLPAALAVALAPTRKAIHDLGYPNADDAIERAALRLAEEVGRYQKMRCEGCGHAYYYDGEPMCGRATLPASPGCAGWGGGCLAFEPRGGDEP